MHLSMRIRADPDPKHWCSSVSDPKPAPHGSVKEMPPGSGSGYAWRDADAGKR